MKKSALVLGFFLLLAPNFAGAQTPSCSAKGYTVVFINGIFDTREQADNGKTRLEFQLGSQYNGEPVHFKLGYNPTHLAGAGDLVQAASQLFVKPVSSFDLNTVLLDIYPKVTTRKLLLVGHSQGAFYTNDMYHYLLSNGEPAESVAIYNVASPAAFTAGHGKYLNSSGDAVLSHLRSLGLDMLPNNIDLVPTDNTAMFAGHTFDGNYLSEAGEKIQSDINDELQELQSTYATDSGDCFTPPTKSLGYKTEAVAFAAVDPAAVGAKKTIIVAGKTAVIAYGVFKTFAIGALQFFSDTITVTTSPPSDTKATQDTFKVINSLYGSSVDKLDAQDTKELLGGTQGASVALAVAATKPKPELPGVVLGTSTEVVEVVATSTTPASIFPFSSNGPVWTSGGGSAAPVVVLEPVAPVVVVADTTDVGTESPKETEVVPDTTATTTLETATSTPPTPTVVLPTGAPFTDTFDAFDPVAWTTPDDPYHTLIKFDQDPDSSECQTNGCLIANGGLGGLGTGSQTAFMFKHSGVGQTAGHFSVWGKSNHGQGGIGVCTVTAVDDCQSQSKRYLNTFPDDNTWHLYYLAWRQGAEMVETCLLMDDITAPCTWYATLFPLGTEFDGVLLVGFAPRPDLGTHVWFDELAEGPTPN